MAIVDSTGVVMVAAEWEHFSEGEPYPGGESYPEVGPYPEPEPGNDNRILSKAEPIPDWSQALQAANIDKDIRVFGFVFLLVSAFCVFALRRRRTVLSAVQFKTSLVALSFCILRAFVLFTIGHDSRDHLPLLLGNMIWGIAFSCLAAAFSLMLVILIETIQFRSTLPCITIQGHILAVSTIIYVVILITTDVILVYMTSIQVTLIVCRLFFVIWGAIMMIGYFTVSYRMHRNTLVSTAESRRCSKASFERISALLSLTGMILLAIQIYATFDVVSDLAVAESPAPWTWRGLQTSLRVLEALMCGLLMLITRVAEQHQQEKQFDGQKAMDITKISATTSELRINVINTTQMPQKV